MMQFRDQMNCSVAASWLRRAGEERMPTVGRRSTWYFDRLNAAGEQAVLEADWYRAKNTFGDHLQRQHASAGNEHSGVIHSDVGRLKAYWSMSLVTFAPPGAEKCLIIRRVPSNFSRCPGPVERRVGRIRKWSCHVSKALFTQGGIHIVWMVESQAQLGRKGVKAVALEADRGTYME